MQQYLVLPVCVLYFFPLNIGYIRTRQARLILHDLYNLAALILVFNSIVYGLYYSQGFRSAVESVIPALKGFQFSRTAFFNPFLWYGMFCMAMIRLALWAGTKAGPCKEDSPDSGSRRENRKRRRNRQHAAVRFLPWLLTAASIVIIVMSGNDYNDLLNTAKAEVKRAAGLPESDTLNYGEFYSVSLFEKVKKDIGYDGEWSLAYGFHPAVLEYSGISTLDGYLGFYSQEYKEQFPGNYSACLVRK